MKSPFVLHRSSGLTWVEALVGVAILAILLAVAKSYLVEYASRDHMMQELSNMKQLHLTTQQMACDGETEGNTALAWPGDTGGSFTNWTARLVPAYLTTNDFCKLLSAPGRITPPGKLPCGNTNGLLVYAVSSNSPDETIFLTTANLTNTPIGPAPLDPAATPYGSRGAYVFYKGGDGSVLVGKALNYTNAPSAYAPLLQ